MSSVGANETIGGWSVTTLTRVLKDIFERNPPRMLPVLECDQLTVHEKLLVRKDVQFLGQDFRTVGNTGQPAFQSGWVNFGAGWAAASFVKAPDGWVRLHGIVSVPTNPVGLPSTIFTLPPGYRPEASCVFSTIASNAVARIDITSAGLVQAVAPTPTAAPWISLETITFKAV